jgi:hypothetical protein
LLFRCRYRHHRIQVPLPEKFPTTTAEGLVPTP